MIFMIELIVLLGALLHNVSSSPLLREEIESNENTPSRFRRSPSADLVLNQMRAASRDDLIRRYLLAQLLERVKGKRSGHPFSDRLDYKRIYGVILRNELSKRPWFLVDSKRDIHTDEENTRSARFGVNLEYEEPSRILNDDALSTILESEISLPEAESSENSSLNDENPNDEKTDSEKLNLMQLLAA